MKTGQYRQNGPSATQSQYLIKIIRQMWKLTNIAKMGHSEDQQ